MATGSTSPTDNRTHGTYIHKVPDNLIHDWSAFERAVKDIYPNGVQVSTDGEMCIVMAISDTAEPADLSKKLQEDGVILQE
ncbi:hypothetical protein FSARC_2658 [Fusarium sarcochroum]|uniref:Uncharacterized protein n=1 Tax=Fusarium sarcochroum TaxID=1208366 RepID=A0A8H4XDE4_9HYPO|nr:hypothetical protein FSARC_2658 [Fusarium sarcochroum]